MTMMMMMMMMRGEKGLEFLPKFFDRSLLCKYPTIPNNTQQNSTIPNMTFLTDLYYANTRQPNSPAGTTPHFWALSSSSSAASSSSSFLSALWRSSSFFGKQLETKVLANGSQLCVKHRSCHEITKPPLWLCFVAQSVIIQGVFHWPPLKR